MSDEQILEKVKAAIANVCGMEPSEIPDDAHFVDDLGLDSLSFIEAFVELERQFKIGQATEEAEKSIVSVGTAVSYIRGQLSVQTA